MYREEVEKLLEGKILKDSAPLGLYDAGLQFVVVSLKSKDDADLQFDWYDNAVQLDDFIK